MLASIRAHSRARASVHRIGNDAALLRAGLSRPVVCVDQTIEGVHFDARAPARQIAHKACARALSDLAASAATPRALLLALRAPRSTSERRLLQLIEGVRATAAQYGCELVGGDTSCAAGPLGLTVTALGELPAKLRSVSRDRARPGQIVVATGAFGGSRLGRHLAIEPRLAAGRWLAELGATAMLDTSDGLARDLARIAELSRVRVEIGFVPIHADARRAARADRRTALEHALDDGEDHELVATLPARVVRRALHDSARICPGFAVLGRVRAGAGVWVPRDEIGDETVRWNGRGGWVHGA